MLILSVFSSSSLSCWSFCWQSWFCSSFSLCTQTRYENQAAHAPSFCNYTYTTQPGTVYRLSLTTDTSWRTITTAHTPAMLRLLQFLISTQRLLCLSLHILLCILPPILLCIKLHVLICILLHILLCISLRVLISISFTFWSVSHSTFCPVSDSRFWFIRHSIFICFSLHFLVCNSPHVLISISFTL